MANRSRIINCQQDGTESTYCYTLLTGWHREHVLLYTVNSMAHRSRIIINCQQDGTPKMYYNYYYYYYYKLSTGWHTEHVLLLLLLLL